MSRPRSPGQFSHQPNRIDKHVGKRIREARRNKGLSREELAHRLDISRAKLEKLESGVARCKPSVLFAIADELLVPIGWFFRGLDLGGND